MAFIVPKCNINNAIRATSYVVPSPLAPAVSLKVSSHSISTENPPYFITSTKLSSALPIGSGAPRAISGVTTKSQCRFAHTDLTFPNYEHVRRNSTLDPKVPAKETRDGRKAFTYLFTAGTAALVAVGAKQSATKAVKYFGYNQDALAMGTVELDLSSIPEGRAVTLVWQGKPLFVKHRTPDEIADAQNTPMSDLRDPQSDSDRVKKPEWLITLGICTHLGCVPMANKGDFLGGYFCPCHGSHYDSSGRIRKGPAPENLEIPPYYFSGDKTITVG